MKKQGFSLVELAIVLVILGLLTGGILAGRALIRASELRSVTREYEQFRTATHTFRDKYLALPGDMPNAETFWGTAATSNADCQLFDSTGVTATCNGNGDGRTHGAWRGNERFRFWHHLANAGLIEGSYSGIEGSSGNGAHSAYANSGRSKLDGGLWAATYFDHSGGGSGSSTFAVNYGHSFLLGKEMNISAPTAPLMRTEELWNIDTKIDDGLPAQGRIWSARVSGCTTASNATDFTSEYNFTNTNLVCAMRTRNSF